MISGYGNYTKVYDFMITELKLFKIELLVYAYVFSYTIDNRSYRGSQQTLANRFGVSRPTINNTLKSLVEKGLLIKTDIEIPQGKGCEYTCDLTKITLPCKKI